jgi:ABC-type cobalt transport system substrate-binding protein
MPLQPSQYKIDDERKNEMLAKLRNYRTSEDSIAYIFALLEEENFSAEDRKIHTAIFHLKEKYPSFFEDLIFSRNDLYPFSKELEKILFRFQQSGILTTMNPAMRFYRFPLQSKKRVLDYLSKKFTEKEKQELLEISKELHKSLK